LRHGAAVRQPAGFGSEWDTLYLMLICFLKHPYMFRALMHRYEAVLLSMPKLTSLLKFSQLVHAIKLEILKVSLQNQLI